jgi:hypothetical protein
MGQMEASKTKAGPLPTAKDDNFEDVLNLPLSVSSVVDSYSLMLILF